MMVFVDQSGDIAAVVVADAADADAAAAVVVVVVVVDNEGFHIAAAVASDILSSEIVYSEDQIHLELPAW